MQLKVIKSRALPIGIDLGSAAVKMVQLRRSDDQIELTASAMLEVPLERRKDAGARLDFLTQELRQLLKSRDFKGRECILALPAAHTFVQHVKLARQSAAEMDKALRADLADKLPFDASAAIIRTIVVGEMYGEKEGGVEVIAIAASRDAVEEHLELVHRLKLEPVAVDVEPCAILECFARLFRRADDSNHATMFLDLGQSSTQVVIAHGAKLVFARNLMLGARDLDKAVSARLKVDTRQAEVLRRKLSQETNLTQVAEQLYDAMGEALQSLIGEIGKCVHYYDSVFPSKPVERALFLGGQAQDRRLCQNIAQRLNLPAQVGDPLARVNRAENADADMGVDRRQAQPAWAVAVGLCLGAEMPEAA